MLLILFVIALVIGIAFFQTVQGIFSALVTLILTICSAVLAFNFYEPLSAAVFSGAPNYGNAVCLIVLFSVTLFALRWVYDMYLVRGNVLMGVWPDRIGGGLIGLITAMIVIGVLLVSIQMLPWGAAVLGYKSHDDSLSRDQSFVPFYPDEFTLNLVNKLSAGPLNTEPASPFNQAHDDLLLELYAWHNTGKDASGNPLNGSLSVAPGKVSAVGAFYPPERADLPKWTEDLPPYPLLSPMSPTASAASKVVIVRYEFGDGNGAQDADNQYRLPATHFRLVTQNGKSVYPVGYLTYLPPAEVAKRKETGGPWKLHSATVEKDKAGKDLIQIGKLGLTRPVPEKGTLMVDWVYRLPPDDPPAFAAFRRVAVSPVPQPKKDAMPNVAGALSRQPVNR